MMIKMLVPAVLAACLATGCAQVLPPSPLPTPSPEPLPAPVSSPLTLETAVQAAMADASRRTGLAVEALQLLSASAVTWRDGSIGCPKPGMAYTQALVPGYRVRIRAAGQDLDYHAARRGAVSLCPEGRAAEPLPEDARR